MCVALVLGMLAATTASAQNRISLQEVPFCTYSGWGMDAQKTGDAECAWVVGEASKQPYGDGGVNNRADLSQYSKLIITYTEGTPRVLLNRDKEEGQPNGNEAESHLIDNTNSDCMTWASKYFKTEDGVLTVDLKQLVKDKGFAHLHAIKGANYGNVTITSMEVELAAKPIQVGWNNILNNSDLEGDDVSSFITVINGDSGDGDVTYPAVIEDGVGVNNSRGIALKSMENAPQTWSTQLFVHLPEVLPVGTEWRFSMDVISSPDADVSVAGHAAPRDWKCGGTDISPDFANFTTTSEWKTITAKGTIDQNLVDKNFQSICFDLNNDKTTATQYYFDNIKFEIYKYGTAVEFNSDVIRVDFGNDTNLPELVKACGLPRLMYPKDCATVKVGGNEVSIYSVEGFADGRFYIFLDDPCGETDEVLVSFKNPTDAAYHLVYANGADKGKDVKDFQDVEATNNPAVEDNDGYPYDYMTPTLLKADPEDGSFNLPNSIKEFKLAFDKNVDCAKIQATLNKQKLAVVPATGFAKDITLTREGGDLADGEYTLRVTKIYPEMIIEESVFGDTTYVFNVGKVVDDPDDVEELVMTDDFAASGNSWITTSDTAGEMQDANAGSGSRQMHNQSGFAADILYLCTRGNSSTGGIALYGTKADAKMTLKAKNYHLTLGVAKWDGNNAARSLKVQVLPEDAVDSNTGLILDDSKILVEERKAVEPDFKTTTNATRFDVVIPVTVEGNYVIRMVCGNADGNPGGYGDGCAIGDVKVQYLPNKIGAEWVRLLKGALETAKKAQDKYVDERYAGEAQTALNNAITKYEAEMANYTAPSVYQNAANELEKLTAALENHAKLCNDYDEQIKKAIDVVRQNAEKKFAGLDLYAQVKDLTAKYHGTSEWVNTAAEGEEEKPELQYAYDKLTDDAALTDAIAELKDIVTLAGYLFTEGESKGTTTGVAAAFERTRVGILTLKALGVAEDDALLVEANKGITDDDNMTDALMARTTKELYGKLKDADNNLFEGTFDDDGNVNTPSYDMTVFVKNPNIYKVLPTINYSVENVSGWTVTGATGLWCGWNNTVKNIEGVAEDCAFTIYQNAGVAEQTITNLPAGVYNIVVDAARWDEVDPTGKTFAYYKTSTTTPVAEGEEPIKEVNYDGTIDLSYHGQYVMNFDNTFENVTITDGQLTLGVNFASDGGQYFFDKVKIYLVGKAENYDYGKAYDEFVAGINESIASDKVRAIELYDLNGRRVTKAQKGLVIMKQVMSDGSIRTLKVVK